MNVLRELLAMLMSVALAYLAGEAGHNCDPEWPKPREAKVKTGGRAGGPLPAQS